MTTIQISDLHPTESDLLFYAELSPEEAAQIHGEGLFGAVVGGILGAGVGVAAGWPTGPGMIIFGIAGAGIGAAWGSHY